MRIKTSTIKTTDLRTHITITIETYHKFIFSKRFPFIVYSREEVHT